jgi:hypothetical protein
MIKAERRQSERVRAAIHRDQRQVGRLGRERGMRGWPRHTRESAPQQIHLFRPEQTRDADGVVSRVSEKIREMIPDGRTLGCRCRYAQRWHVQNRTAEGGARKQPRHLATLVLGPAAAQSRDQRQVVENVAVHAAAA